MSEQYKNQLLPYIARKQKTLQYSKYFFYFLPSLTISLRILPAVPFLFWVLKQVQ